MPHAVSESLRNAAFIVACPPIDGLVVGLCLSVCGGAYLLPSRSPWRRGIRPVPSPLKRTSSTTAQRARRPLVSAGMGSDTAHALTVACMPASWWAGWQEHSCEQLAPGVVGGHTAASEVGGTVEGVGLHRVGGMQQLPTSSESTGSRCGLATINHLAQATTTHTLHDRRLESESERGARARARERNILIQVR